MSKAAQYATIDDKVFKDLGVVSIKSTQSSLQAYITWPKKSSMLIKLVLALQTFIGCAYVLYNGSFFSISIVDCRQGGKVMEVSLFGFWFAWTKTYNFIENMFASKVAMFEQCLAYQVAIMCYSHQTKVLPNMILELYKIE